MIRISLTEEEKLALNQLRLSKKSNIGERAYYVLLSHQGKSLPEIAKHLSRNGHTIRLWLQRYMSDGITGLKNHINPGRPAKKAPFIESHLQELLNVSPQKYGYQEAGWQINILRDWFAKQGLQACDNTLVKSLDKLGFVYKRFSKTLPLNAPSSSKKKIRVAEIVEAINKDAEANIEILFADESHFSNQPYVTRGWFKRGEKKR
jgi:transposase